MNVAVERRAEALDKGDRSGLGAGGDGQPRFLDEVCGDRSIHHAQDLAQYLRLGGKQEPQGIGECEHPLPNGLLRQDVIDEMSRGVDHPARAARRAKTTPFARERHQMLMLTAIALDAQEPTVEQAALQDIQSLGVRNKLESNRDVCCCR